MAMGRETSGNNGRYMQAIHVRLLLFGEHRFDLF